MGMRGKGLLLFAAFSFFVAMSIVNICRKPPYVGGDAAQYIIIAKSLSQGQGFRMVNYPSAPGARIAPLLPLVLAAVYKLCGENIFCFRLIIFCFGLGTAVVFYRLFAARLQYETTDVFFLLSLFLSRLFFVYNFRILTDVPFMFLAGLSFLFFKKYQDSDSVVNKYGILTLLFSLFTYFCRYIGVLVLLAIVAALLADRKRLSRKKVLFLCLLFLPLPLAWEIRNLAVKTSYSSSFMKQFSYIDWYKPYLGTILQNPFLFFSRVWNNLVFYSLLLGGNFLFSFLGIKLPLVVRCLFSALIVGMLIKGILAEENVWRNSVLIFSVLYFISILAWPFREDGRYFLPLLPFTAVCIWRGVEVTFRKRIKTIYAVLSVFMLTRAVFAYSAVSGVFPYYHNVSPAVRNFFYINKWLERNIPAGKIIASRKPRITYFYSGHKSMAYPFSKDPALIWRFLERHRIKYLIVDNFSRETYLYIAPFLQKYRARLKLIYRIGNTGLFRIE